MSPQGLAITSRLAEFEKHVDDQLFAGVLSALDSFTREVTGASIETFSTGNVEFHLKETPDHFKLVLVTEPGADSDRVDQVLDRVDALFQAHEGYAVQKECTRQLPENSPLARALDDLLASWGDGGASCTGNLSGLLGDYGLDAVKLWRALQLGQRVLVSSARPDAVAAFLDSVVLLKPARREYRVFPRVSVQDCKELVQVPAYLAGTTSSFLLKMRKDLWDVHVDLDRHRVHVTQPVAIAPFEREGFEEILQLVEDGDAPEPLVRELVANLNAQFRTAVKAVNALGGSKRRLLKQYQFSPRYYSDVIAHLS